MAVRRIANRDASWYTTRRLPFVGSNLYAKELRDPYRYVVYSYGGHWPLYVWDGGVQRWFVNGDVFSRTTSRHKTQACPDMKGESALVVGVQYIKELMFGGYVRFIKERLNGLHS